MDFDWNFFWEVFRGAGKAVPLTLYLSLWSFFFGLLIALVIAILRYKKVFIASLTVFRMIPAQPPSDKRSLTLSGIS